MNKVVRLDEAARVRVEDDSWRELLVVKRVRRGDSEFDAVLPVAANVATIFRYHPSWRGVIAQDAFAGMVVTLKPPPWHPADAPAQIGTGEWTEADSSRAAHWLARRESMQVGPRVVDEAVAVVAESNVVHPVADYLRGLRWDGTARIDTWLPVYFGADDNAYTRGVGARWLISGVARVMSPGCQVDCTLLIEGRQGIGKTSAFRALVPQPGWYADTGLSLGDKDSYQNLRSVWIYGLDELDSLRRSDVTRWKNFLTATRDRLRPSYGRRSRDFARQNVFCGTTNEDAYLTDRTGNRRFWPVRIGRTVDIAGIARERDQLWAEAVTRYRAGEKWHVDTPEFRQLCEEQQAERVQGDPWEEVIAPWLDDPRERKPGDTSRATGAPFLWSTDGLLTSEVLTHAIGKPARDITKADEMRVAEVLRALGYARGPLHRENGRRVRRYVVTSVPAAGDTREIEKTALPSSPSLPSPPARAHTHEKVLTPYTNGGGPIVGGAGGDSDDEAEERAAIQAEGVAPDPIVEVPGSERVSEAIEAGNVADQGEPPVEDGPQTAVTSSQSAEDVPVAEVEPEHVEDQDGESSWWRGA
jgi:hypothetical protein